MATLCIVGKGKTAGMTLIFFSTELVLPSSKYQHSAAIPLAIAWKQSVHACVELLQGGKTMNARVRVLRIVPGSDLITERQKPRILPALKHIDPPNRERVPVAYRRGAFEGLYDAMAE